MPENEDFELTKKRRRRIRRLIAAIPLIFIAIYLFIYGRYYGPFEIEYNDVIIEIENLPGEFDGFRIAHITDMHCGKDDVNAHVHGVFSEIIKRKPDIAVITGDIIHKKYDGHAFAEKEMKRLVETFPVFAIPGNHDRRAGWEKYRDMVEKAGVISALNTCREFEKSGAVIYIAGGSGSRKSVPDTGAIIGGIDNREEAVIIFLIHNPDHFPGVKGNGIDIVLAGHTHGGQVKLPLIGAPVNNVENNSYTGGLIREEDDVMYVCRGIGWTGRFRINCPAEVAFIILRRKQD
ncbi:MAG: metallophosphoesterase [Planctomycetota bacterium]|jgi:predicted MPP superfamily phosphohydrolase